MTNLTPQEKIDIFKNIFRGRDDVFAMHWEKADGSASGYTPVCLNEWKPSICYKLQRKKCKDCPHQKYVGLNDYYIDQHLRGIKLYGIYPLLDNNTSYFLAADFDGKNWEKDILKYYKKCEALKIPILIERSKSGKGGHAWIFFEDKYPAFKSRSIGVAILREAGIIDQFSKEDSFDRLFPNQDILSGKGFGNLIALPLYGKARENNNTIFLDPKNNLEPFIDQWDILQNSKKISLDNLEKIYDTFSIDTDKMPQEKTKHAKSSKLNIVIDKFISINKLGIPKALSTFLREELNFVNSDYLIKKRMGISTYGMEKYFKLIEPAESDYKIPRGFLKNLTNFLDENNIKFSLTDNRNKCENIKYESSCELYDYQENAIIDLLAEENGILVSPPGSGKTIMGIEIINKQKQPALILVHKKQIYDQWLNRIESFLNIPKREIGQFCANKKKLGKQITVAMIQTLSNIEEFEKDFGENNFGLILVDECHHIPAKTFRQVITKFKPFYLYGLTATPKRKNNDEKLIFIYLGSILHVVENNYHIPVKQKTDEFKSVLQVNIKNTKIDVPFKVKIDNFQILSKIITFDSERNKMIVCDLKKEINNGNKCLVLTERKEHVEVLNYYLKGEHEIITLTGDLTEKQKKEKLKQIEAGNFQVLIATGQLIGEGTDFPNLDCLFLVYPFSFEGKLIQYIGRIQRGENSNGKIYDYRDINIKYLEKFYKKRHKYYEKNFDMK
jgi:superfamily II DNA or RNA helicase